MDIGAKIGVKLFPHLFAPQHQHIEPRKRPMENRRPSSIPLPSEMELLGEGESFQFTLCNMLRSAKGFEDFSETDLAFLANHMKAYRALAGNTIFREGDNNSYLCVLIEGRISVYKEDQNGKIKFLATLPQGRIFGEISVIDNLPHSVSLIAETDTIIVLMSREGFRQCVDDNSIVGVRLLGLIAHLLSARLRSASGQLADYIEA